MLYRLTEWIRDPALGAATCIAAMLALAMRPLIVLLLRVL